MPPTTQKSGPVNFLANYFLENNPNRATVVTEPVKDLDGAAEVKNDSANFTVMDGKTDKLDLVVLLAQMGANVSDEDNRVWMIQKEHDEAGTYLDVMFKHAVPEHRVSVHRVYKFDIARAVQNECWSFLQRFLLESYANLIETDEELNQNFYTHTTRESIRRTFGVEMLMNIVKGDMDEWYELIDDVGGFLTDFLDFLRFMYELDTQNGREPVLFIFKEVFAAVEFLSLPFHTETVFSDGALMLVCPGLAAIIDFLTDIQVHIPEQGKAGLVLDLSLIHI